MNRLSGSNSRCSQYPHLPKINNISNNDISNNNRSSSSNNKNNNIKKGRSNTIKDSRLSTTKSTTINNNNTKRQSLSLISLPSVTRSSESCLRHNGRIRSKTEIITSISFSGGLGCGGNKRMKGAVPTALKKRGSGGVSSPQRRWSTISEESNCLTRIKLSLKVPSSPQFQQVLQEIGI